MHLTLRHFEIVDVIAQSRSISRAAGLLGLTQSALTQALQTLEERIGTQLFVRSPQGLEPTDAAGVFLRRNVAISSAMQTLLQDIEQLKRDESGKLVVATGIFAGHISVYDAIGAMSRKYNQLQFDIVQKDWRIIAKDIRAKEIDLGVMELSSAKKDPAFETEPLNTSRVYFIARPGHPLAQRETLTLEDLYHYPLCGGPVPAHISQHFGKNLGIFGSRPSAKGAINPAISTYHLSAIKSILVQSNAISMVPRFMLESEIERGELVRLDRLDAPWLRAGYGFVHLRNRKLSPVLREFMATVREIELKKQKLLTI